MNMDKRIGQRRPHHSGEEVGSAEAREDDPEDKQRHCREKYIVGAHSRQAGYHCGHTLPPLTETADTMIALRIQPEIPAVGPLSA